MLTSLIQPAGTVPRLRLKLLLFLLVYTALGSLAVIQYLHCWNDRLGSLGFGFGPLHDREKRRYRPHLLFARCNVILFLTKSSLTGLCIVLALLPFVAFSRRDLLILNVLILLTGMLAWAGFNCYNSGRFTISSSLDGPNFHKGNNRHTLEYYPRRSLDLTPLAEDERPPAEIKDEWALCRYHRAKALEFIRGHFSSFARLTWRRFFAFFIEVRPYGSTDPTGEAHRPFQHLGVAYMVVFRLLFLTSIVSSWGILLTRTAALSRQAWCYLLMVAAYAAPCVLGYAYERHVIPLVMPTALYFICLVRYRAGDWGISAADVPGAALP